jgi:alpha/beta superfamily hydrolase
LIEQAGYFRVPGAHLYTVLHRVEAPVARVLLVGPFASERHNSYIPWVRWARYLAARQIEVLRYDHRGIGESTGIFEQATFSDWSEDLTLLAEWFKDQSPDVPVLFHGLEFGAILAGRLFHQGKGDGLLLWSAPANANQVLRSTLMRWARLEQLLLKGGDERKSAADYIRQLEQGGVVEVEGYEWSSSLWHASFGLELPAGLADMAAVTSGPSKPVRIVELGKAAAPLVKGGTPGFDELRDFDWLYSENMNWLSAELASLKGMASDRHS